MRLLHTSDWHLGQTFHGFERAYEHERFLGWLLDTLEAERADALLVAGDVFDHANPSAAAQHLLYRFLSEAKRRLPRLDIVLIAGNHDSPGRLEAPLPLLNAFGVRVVGQARSADGALDVDRLRVPLRDRRDRIAAWCLAVPFLRPSDLSAAELDQGDEDRGQGPPAESMGDAYARRVAGLYRRLLAGAMERREHGQAIIALGHCHLAGGTVSLASERRIVVGGSEALPATVFDPALAYVALGHLHRAQCIAGDERLRYAGSPMPLSFREIDYPHQIVRIELDGERAGAIEAIPVPRFVALERVPERPQPLTEVLAALAALERPAAAADQQPYLEVQVQLEAPEPGLRARIEAALGGKPVRLARIDVQRPTRPGNGTAPLSLEDLGQLRPEDVFRQLYREHYGDEAPAPLLAAFAELLQPETP